MDSASHWKGAADRTRRPDGDESGSRPLGETRMTKLLGFIGATIGGWIGWAIGAPVGVFTAFAVSMVGTGVGIYYGRRAAEHWL